MFFRVRSKSLFSIFCRELFVITSIKCCLYFTESTDWCSTCTTTTTWLNCLFYGKNCCFYHGSFVFSIWIVNWYNLCEELPWDFNKVINKSVDSLVEYPQTHGYGLAVSRDGYILASLVLGLQVHATMPGDQMQVLMLAIQTLYKWALSSAHLQNASINIRELGAWPWVTNCHHLSKTKGFSGHGMSVLKLRQSLTNWEGLGI